MKQLGDERELDVEVLVFGIYSEGEGGAIKPVLMQLEGEFFLPVYSSLEKLRRSYAEAGVGDFLKIKQVTDVREFLDSVEGMKVVMDPWITEEGNTRYMLLR